MSLKTFWWVRNFTKDFPIVGGSLSRSQHYLPVYGNNKFSLEVPSGRHPQVTSPTKSPPKVAPKPQHNTNSSPRNFHQYSTTYPNEAGPHKTGLVQPKLQHASSDSCQLSPQGVISQNSQLNVHQKTSPAKLTPCQVLYNSQVCLKHFSFLANNISSLVICIL